MGACMALSCLSEPRALDRSVGGMGCRGTAPATRGHMLDFLAAIDKKSRPIADIEAGHISTASCIIANLSMRLGRPLSYDPVKKVIINDPEATALLARPYRGPWNRNMLK